MRDFTNELYEEERLTIQRAAQLRCETFSSGRRAARDAIAALGYPLQALPRADDGSVEWPEGLIGSLSHTCEWAIAVTAIQSQCEAVCLGIDLECVKPLEIGVKRLIATPAELAQMSSPDVPNWHAIALFSLKESIYKCLAKHFGRFIGFHDVQLTGLDSDCPMVKFSCPELERQYPASRLELRLTVSDGHVLTLAWLRA